jgi:hypothetical protein
MLWLDGADPAGTGVLPSNNSVLSTWADKSGNGLNMTGASGQPSFLTNAFNGKPTVSFTAIQGVSTQQLTNASTSLFNSLTNLSVFVVMYIPGTTPSYPVPIALFNKVIIYMRGASAGGVAPGNLYPWTYNGASNVYSLNNFVSVNNYYICCFQFNTNQSFFMNGDIGTGGPTPFSFGSGTNIPIYIGTSTYNTSDGFNGYLSEIIIYTSAITTTQRQTVESYLAQKWGLQGSLPRTHPNFTNPAGLPAVDPSLTRGLTRLPPIVATGGTITFSGNFKIHTFTTVGTTNFAVTSSYPAQVQVLVVGGGGGGGGLFDGGGGGGGGALLAMTTITTGTYPVIVGGGGTGWIDSTTTAPLSGSNSLFNSIVGFGGGSGGYKGNNGFVSSCLGVNGGCGGGGGWSESTGGITSNAAGGIGSQGYNGGLGGSAYLSAKGGGGGGGMGGVGGDGTSQNPTPGYAGGAGGLGISFTMLNGTVGPYSGGGGGGTDGGLITSAGTGGSGVGGAGGSSYGYGSFANGSGSNGVPNTGGGGGGQFRNNGGNGGSGIVIIAYNYL